MPTKYRIGRSLFWIRIFRRSSSDIDAFWFKHIWYPTSNFSIHFRTACLRWHGYRPYVLLWCSFEHTCGSGTLGPSNQLAVCWFQFRQTRCCDSSYGCIADASGETS